jgi:hypothetical protein
MKFRMFTFLTAATLFGVLPTRWSTFLKAHWECLTATDFMSVEVCTIKGLVLYRPPLPIGARRRY